VITQGNKLGRTIGYPTANIDLLDKEKMVPGNGVYAVYVIIRGRTPVLSEEIIPAAHQTNIDAAVSFKSLKGMMNIGNRPTIGGGQRTIEVNIFDFDEDIYGMTMRVYVKHHIRSEKKMDGLASLKEQLSRDKLQAIYLLR
jgi:riboflavin kinase/FMN adenylyltransferase